MILLKIVALADAFRVQILQLWLSILRQWPLRFAGALEPATFDLKEQEEIGRATP